jgi:hypothetical protein
MNIVANFEHRASSSRGKHEGESSVALCDRLGRTRDNSQRQLPRIMIMRFRPANIRLINRRLKLPRLLLALSSRKRKDNYKNIPTDFAVLTWSLHIRVVVHRGVIGSCSWWSVLQCEDTLYGGTSFWSDIAGSWTMLTLKPSLTRLS